MGKTYLVFLSVLSALVVKKINSTFFLTYSFIRFFMNLKDDYMKKILAVLTKYRCLFHFYLSLFLLILIIQNAAGQTIIATGTTMRIASGTKVVLNNQLTIQSGGVLNNAGSVNLKNNLANQNALLNNLGAGVFSLTGASNQTISGQNVFQNLGISNPAGVTVAGNTMVNGILTLNSGITSLGNSNLSLGATAMIAGSPSATNMIATTGSGQLQKMFPPSGPASAWTFTFPVGDGAGAAEYSPLTLAFNSGTFGADNYAGVNLADAQYPGSATSYLTRYWNVAQSGISGFSCNATFQYPVADVVGSESDIFSFKVDPVLPWTAYNAADAAMHQLTIHGLSSFGTFTGNLGDAAVPPAIRSLQDKNISSGLVTCADASQTLLIAGNGTFYSVQSGGSVTHIAGQTVIYSPGTKVFAGGYLHGYISTVFCNPYIHPVVKGSIAEGDGDQTDPLRPDNGFFKIYPNPTTGKFTLELTSDISSEQAHVDIFGILGEKIFSKDLILMRTQEFSLAERSTGVYVVHVTSGVNTRCQKIIRH
jgi:hypothetical protein